MYCSKCGTQIPEDSDFCTSCGAKIIKEIAEAQPKPKAKITGRTKIVIIIAVCLVSALGALLLINEIGKANLKKQLMRDWERFEIDDNSYYTYVLDFSEDEIEFNFESFFVNDTIATYDYTLISGNKFKIDRRNTLYTVEFNDDKTMLIITPSFTGDGGSEYWFNHDD